jgi:GNAT superfamily N-acetyltransferase
VGQGMTIKKLLPQDFDKTLYLFHEYRDEAIQSLPYIEEEYDEETVIEVIREYAILESHCWLNLYQGQTPIGFIAGYLVSKPWNKNLVLGHIQFIFVLEEHRNLEVFRDLLEAFEDWTKNFKAVGISAGDIGIDPDKMRKLYEHFDFKSELSMVKEL